MAEARLRHAHHLVGDLIGLLLVEVSRGADGELRLQPRGRGGVLWSPAERMKKRLLRLTLTLTPRA
jgi:hypothetical protein